MSGVTLHLDRVAHEAPENSWFPVEPDGLSQGVLTRSVRTDAARPMPRRAWMGDLGLTRSIRAVRDRASSWPPRSGPPRGRSSPARSRKTPSPHGRQPRAPRGRLPDYLIAPGDVLRIAVWREPELSVEASVRLDGRITVPLLGDLMAAGRAPNDLAAEIQSKLSRFLEVPAGHPGRVAGRQRAVLRDRRGRQARASTPSPAG